VNRWIAILIRAFVRMVPQSEIQLAWKLHVRNHLKNQAGDLPKPEVPGRFLFVFNAKEAEENDAPEAAGTHRSGANPAKNGQISAKTGKTPTKS
jgi:hypothetical protein